MNIRSRREENGENMNMKETNREIKAEEEFSVGKEIESNNDDVQKEESFRACSKDRYEY